MNKKAQLDTGYSSAGTVIQAVVFLLFASAMGGALTYVINNAITDNITIDEKTEEFLVIESVRNCLLYKNNERVYYTMINPADITDDRLSSCFPHKNIAVKLENSYGTEIASAKTSISSGLFTTPKYFIYNIPNSNELHKLAVMYRG